MQQDKRYQEEQKEKIKYEENFTQNEIGSQSTDKI